MVQNEEMGRGLHRQPDVFIRQNALIVSQADIVDLPVGPVGAKIGEAQIDRPDQREDVHRQQQKDRRQNEKPGYGAIAQAPDFGSNRGRRRFRHAVDRGV